MKSVIRTVPFGALSRQIDEMFGDLLSGPGGAMSESTRAFPAVDVREDEKNFYVEADVPGFTQEQVDVTLHQKVLTIKGERVEDSTQRDEGLIRRERFGGSFSRSFRLVSEIDSSKISAALKNGVLSVVLPKAAEAQARKIAVQTE